MPPRKQPKTAAEKAKAAAAEEDAWLDAEASRSQALLDAAAAEAAAATPAPVVAAVAVAPLPQEAEERVKYCCNWCQAANPEMACGRCKTKYCSTECQTKAWPKHMDMCEVMSGRDATEAARRVNAGEG